MGIFSRKKPKVQNELSTSRHIYWGGGTASGIFVTEESAMRVSAVYSCVRVLAESIASLPVHVYRREGENAKRLAEHHLHPLLHYAPNDEMTSFSFREAMMLHLLLYGNCYAHIIRDSAGRVKSMYPLLPDKMDMWRNKQGEIYYTYWQDRDEANSGDESNRLILRKDQVFHIPALSFNGLSGYNPIDLNKDAIGMAIATEKFGASFFANNSTPSGVLENPAAFSEKSVDSLRDAWEVIHKGAKNSNKVAVLHDGIKYTSISVPNDQAQFLETRKFQLNEVS
jgi:HK97 family phage portal protein